MSAILFQYLNVPHLNAQFTNPYNSPNSTVEFEIQHLVILFKRYAYLLVASLKRKRMWLLLRKVPDAS